jgi:hypothetical protein
MHPTREERVLVQSAVVGVMNAKARWHKFMPETILRIDIYENPVIFFRRK